MPKTQPLSALFKIGSGHQLSKSRLNPVGPDDESIAYVSRTHRRNGLDGWTAPIPGLAPASAGSITVCLRSRNHALASFVQPFPFYTTYHVAVLTPLKEMSTAEMLWWCKCIEQNRFRFNFGRQANRTLGSLLVPAQVPDAILGIEEPAFEKKQTSPVKFPAKGWPLVELTRLFDLLPGKQTVRRSMAKGRTPWVSGSAENNGITAYVEMDPEFEAGCLTVANNGSIGATFYQPDAFTASSDVTVMRPKFQMSPLCGMFVCAVMRKEAFRYNYARKWNMGRMQETRIPFPMDANGKPQTHIVEKIVSSSPYASLVA